RTPSGGGPPPLPCSWPAVPRAAEPTGALPQCTRRTTHSRRSLPHPPPPGREGRARARTHPPSPLAALVRNAPARRRRGLARRPGPAAPARLPLVRQRDPRPRLHDLRVLALRLSLPLQALGDSSGRPA